MPSHRSLLLFLAATTGGIATAFVRAPVTTVTTSDYYYPSPSSSSSKPFGSAVTGPVLTNTGTTTTTTTKSCVRQRRQSRHVLQSAKVIPYAFRSASAMLIVKAANIVRTNNELYKKTDIAVIVATALISFFGFADKDNAKLKAAKRAVKRIEQQQNKNIDEETASAARSYKKAVRVKIFGQFLGLLWMAGGTRTGPAVLRSAAAIVSFVGVFLRLGGGRFRHNVSGRLDPLPTATIRNIWVIDGSVVVAALVASMGEGGVVGGVWSPVCAGYVAFGLFVAALQGMARPSNKKAKETPNDSEG